MESINIPKFEELLKEELPLVVDFYATWCGPCKMLAPIMEEAEKRYEGKATFVKIDTDRNIELAARYGIMSIPVVAVFKNGEEVAKTLGYMSKEEMDEFLEENI